MESAEAAGGRDRSASGPPRLNQENGAAVSVETSWAPQQAWLAAEEGTKNEEAARTAEEAPLGLQDVACIPEDILTATEILFALEETFSIGEEAPPALEEVDCIPQEILSVIHLDEILYPLEEATPTPDQTVPSPEQVMPAPEEESMNEEEPFVTEESPLALEDVDHSPEEMLCATQVLHGPQEATSVLEGEMAAPEDVLFTSEKVAPAPEEDDEELLRRHVPFLTEEQLRSLGRGRRLGVGGFGSVRQLQYEGNQAVVKELLRAGDLASLLREARVLVDLNGAGGVPRLLALCLAPLAMVQEFLGHTYDYYLGGCSVEQFLKSLINICHRLEEVHAKGYVHNDIKFNNITFIGTTSEPEFHIIDFGMACHVGETLFKWARDLTDREARAARKKAKHAICGDTIEKFLSSLDGKAAGEDNEDDDTDDDDDYAKERTPWMAPEVLGGKPVLPSGDVYSLGYLMELLMQSSPLTFLARPLRRLSHLCTSWEPSPRPSLPQVAEGVTKLLQHLTAAQLATKFGTHGKSKDEQLCVGQEPPPPLAKVDWSPQQFLAGSLHGAPEEADWSPQQVVAGSLHGAPEEADWSPQQVVAGSLHGPSEEADWSPQQVVACSLHGAPEEADWSPQQVVAGSLHGPSEEADWSPQQVVAGSLHGAPEEADWSLQQAVAGSLHGASEEADWSPQRVAVGTFLEEIISTNLEETVPATKEAMPTPEEIMPTDEQEIPAPEE
ncbi:hypothetical protein O3P69_003497 [Scylla paramamosain]|uniref:non-specific serine/threonine protein kinase n=1 Tax=Scylla paramamosain TaxID=85552 RepID=A0AAW0UIX3_SCYPA